MLFKRIWQLGSNKEMQPISLHVQDEVQNDRKSTCVHITHKKTRIVLALHLMEIVQVHVYECSILETVHVHDVVS